MSVGISAAEGDGRVVRVAVCGRMEGGACACPPGTVHPEFEFTAAPPDGATAAEWEARCAQEALRLVTAADPPRAVALPALVGLTL